MKPCGCGHAVAAPLYAIRRGRRRCKGLDVTLSMRRVAPLVVVVALAACGGSASKPVDLGAAAKRLTSARFTITIRANVAGVAVETQENGTVYSNANVMLALADPTVKPWIKQRRNTTHVDDVDHVRALAALASAAVDTRRLGKDHYRARVEPSRLESAVAKVVRTDYVATPFPAEFWLDEAGRLERVHVAYRTAKGGQISVDGVFSDFGTKVDVTPPEPRDVETVTPANG